MMTSTKTARRHILTASAAVLCAFIVPARVHAQAYQYNVEILSAVGSTIAIAKTINASGDVAAITVNPTTSQYSATVWNGTNPTVLGRLANGYDTVAYGINASGQVVGFAENASGRKGVVWNGTSPTILTGLTSSGGIPYSINDAGTIAGQSNSKAVIWNGTTPTALGSLGGSNSIAYGINNAGQVVGWSKTSGDAATNAVRWNGTVPTTLDGLGGTSFAYAINATGQAAGLAYTTGNSQAKAVIWNGTTPTTLGSLGGNFGSAYGINDAGQVIGMSGSRAFFYADGAMYDLNTLLVPGSGVTDLGFYASSGGGLNNNGQIAATGSYGGQQVIVRLSRSSIPDPAVLYWSGTQDSTWNKASNWAINSAGATAVSAGPVGTTDVIFSTTNAINRTTTLGAGMAVHSLTMNDTNTVSIGGANTLTITGGNAVTVGSGAGMLTISSGLALTPVGVSAPSIVVNNNAGVLISGAISGTKGLTKAGGGTLTLSGANTYTGTTTISAGTLSIGSDINLGAAPASAVADLLTLDGGTLETNATMALHVNRGITLTANGGTLNTDSGTVLLVPGAISGSGSLTKTGNGTLILSGTQTYVTLLTNGGTTNVDSAIGTGSSTVVANATTNFHVSQTLASLSIGDGVEVTFGDGLPLVDESEKIGGSASVPEPGSFGLMLIGTLALAMRRRQTSFSK